MSQSRSITTQKGFDWITLTIYLSLVFIGWIMLYATTLDHNAEIGIPTFDSPIGKQTIWIGISLFVFICVLAMDWTFWHTLAYPIYGVTLVLLVAVLIFGAEIKGAKSWFAFGSISFQPGEIAKLGTALALASYLSYYKSSLKDTKSFLITMGIIFIPIILVLLQPDAGSGLIFLSFFILLYRVGLSNAYYIIGISFVLTFIFSLIYNPLIVGTGIAIIASLPLVANLSKKRMMIGLTLINVFLFIAGIFVGRWELIAGTIGFIFFSLCVYNWRLRKEQLSIISIFSVIILSSFSFISKYAFDNVLEPHQQDRINVWLQPEKCDPRGSLYNITQSKLAIGSGGFGGKGFLKGTMTSLNYVPEQSTDFIFSTIGEEQGFIGSLGVIILFSLLLIRITIIAERAKHKFITYYAYGLAGIIFVHFFVNIGMTMGIMPIIGIPLPFISKGGSSLLIFSIMIAILLKMDLSRYRIKN